MTTPIVCDGDQLMFEPMFGPRQVVLSAPASITGTGVAMIGKRRICVTGDETRAQWTAQYFMPGYAPGTGTVRILMLDSSQSAPYIKGRAPVILKGMQFTAQFTPTVPAVLSSPPGTPDSTAPSTGRGVFMPRQWFGCA
ncbi:hypothetical protein [Caballeronia sp. LZ043]|uniref:hypothetical protein n=1 Tax=Caballeronia sp. LZ043 TaxID=3038569 RepID=UPI00286101E0|nr:hypothetical protein [Caballeronia sp. LZ043]MDR5823097.1 hypothetical protein [Caballeronia sp. LZ043]